MPKYITPYQQISNELQRTRSIIHYLVITLIILFILIIFSLGCFISQAVKDPYLNDPTGLFTSMPGLRPSPFVGMAFLCLHYWPIFLLSVCFVVVVAILPVMSCNSFTDPLQSSSAVIIERTSQPQDVAVSGTPIG